MDIPIGMFDDAPIGIYITEKSGGYYYVNKRWCEITNISKELAYGQGWARGLHPEDHYPVLTQWIEAVTDKKPFVLEHRFMTANGEIVWVSSQATPLSNVPNGVYGFLGVLIDISDFKQTQVALQENKEKYSKLVNVVRGPTEDEHISIQLSKQLEESQALYEISQTLAGTMDLSATLQQIADAATFLIKSSSRTILHLLDETSSYLQAVAVSGSDRPTDEHRLNFKLGEGIAGVALAMGQTINVSDVLTDSRYVPIKPGVSPLLRSLLVAPVRTGEKSLGTLSVQSPLIGAFSPNDERLLTTLGAQAAVAIEKAKLYADLQDSLQHEKATRAQLVQSEKLAALGRIVASVAHELNNPLQAIQNALYLVNLEESLSPQARQDMQTVLNEADRMANLIARLRETYRPAAREEFQPDSINALVLEVQQLLSTHLRHNQVVFEFNPDLEVPDFPIIRDQIKQVILNICLNAVEAMPDGGNLTVETRYLPREGLAVMSIADTGESIDTKILPYIFDPFVTTKEKDGGTGLGLAITYDIVQRHHGRIEVKSEKGKGTIFKVWLPSRQGFEES